MIYPTILVVTGGVSIIILLTFVLPRFSVIFAELGSSLPISTQILLAASELLKSYGWIFLIGIVAVWWSLRRYIASERGRYWWDGLKLRLMDDVIRKLETARFCRTLGTLLAGGVLSASGPEQCPGCDRQPRHCRGDRSRIQGGQGGKRRSPIPFHGRAFSRRWRSR